ncbi:hypothetical protein QOT17_012487 [Balamuthia mandrillaris]
MEHTRSAATRVGENEENEGDGQREGEGEEQEEGEGEDQLNSQTKRRRIQEEQAAEEEADLLGAVRLLEGAAQKGEADAQCLLACGEAAGEGGAEQNVQEAVRRYRAAAERGYAPAQYHLAVLFDREGSPENAFKWFLAAAKQGRSDAMFNVATCFARGRGVGVQPEEAVAWYSAAVQKDGHPMAKYKLAKCLFKGHGVDANTGQATQYLLQLAKRENFPDCYKLGRRLEELALQSTEGSKGLLRTAAKMYCKALRKHHPKAKQRLAGYSFKARNFYYLNRIDDEEKAIYWYLIATIAREEARERARAQFNFALALSGGTVLHANNEEEAGKWFLAAAKLNHAAAQYFVARRLAAYGKKEEAMEWFLASARQGFADSQYQVAIRRFEATDEQEEKRKAVEQIKQVAKENDYPPAMLWLAKYWRAEGQFTTARKYLHRVIATTGTAEYPDVRQHARVMLRMMNHNKEGLLVRSLVTMCKLALAKDLSCKVMDVWQSNLEKMKQVPTELWQEMLPWLPQLVLKQGKEMESEEEYEAFEREEGEYTVEEEDTMQHVHKEEQEVGEDISTDEEKDFEEESDEHSSDVSDSHQLRCCSSPAEGDASDKGIFVTMGSSKRSPLPPPHA